MIAIELDVPTKGDLQSAENLRERWCELNGKIHYLLHTSGMLLEQIEHVINACTSGVALFESGSSGRRTELKRELAAMRCHVKRARVASKIAEVEAALQGIINELCEIKMHDQLRGLLDKCSD